MLFVYLKKKLWNCLWLGKYADNYTGREEGKFLILFPVKARITKMTTRELNGAR